MLFSWYPTTSAGPQRSTKSGSHSKGENSPYAAAWQRAVPKDGRSLMVERKGGKWAQKLRIKSKQQQLQTNKAKPAQTEPG